MSAWVIFAIFMFLFVIGTPLFVCMGLACVLCIVHISHADAGMLFQQMFTLTDHDALLAIPFFTLTAALMTAGSSARRLTALASSLVEWLPGGLGLATILSCVFFSAMCGLSPAAIVAVGAIMMPAMLESGWPERFSLGLVTSSGSLGVLLPPSLVMIVLLVVASGSMEDYNSALAVKKAEDAARARVAVTARGGGDVSNTDVAPSWAAPVGGEKKSEGEAALAGSEAGAARGAGAAKEEVSKPETFQPTTINIKNLFVAAVGPTFLMGAIFCAFTVFTGLRNGVRRGRFKAAELGRNFFAGLPSLLLPVIAVGGIMSGKLTVLQAAAAVAVYALLLEIIIYRSVRLRALPGVFREAGAITGMILIILSVTFVFNWFLTTEGLPIRVSDFITSHFHSKLAFLLTVNILFLFLGCIMDILSAVFITVPLLMPAAMAIGIDPVHFCIIFVANFEIGYLTPPVGLPLFTSGAVFKKDLVEVSRSVMPFLGLLLIALAIITYFPSLSLWLVRATGG